MTESVSAHHRLELSLPEDLRARVDLALERLTKEGFVERLWARDTSLWPGPAAEISQRLGWLDSPEEMRARADTLASFAAAVAGNGVSHAVVLGMGGSSLFPEVTADVFRGGGIEMSILDTVDPAAIRRLESQLPLDETLFVVASKSGTTIETRSQLAYFWQHVGNPDQFVAITDPGTPLALRARESAFRAVFENDPTIGGRFSALSLFGLLPAALVGVDLEEFVERGRRMLEACRAPESENPGTQLASTLGAAYETGRDKLTLVCGQHIEAFAAWLEQLVAESTGKQGRGILPIPGEPVRSGHEYGSDRIFAVLGREDADPLRATGHPVLEVALDDPYDLAGEVVRWEVAVAALGHLLELNPFDEPDVERAKEATRQVLAEGIPQIPAVPPEDHLREFTPNDYLALQAFVDPHGSVAQDLREATWALGRHLGVSATFGLGPRYLHSTGQFHKGGPPTGVFVQVVTDDPSDLEIPDAGFGFSELKHAQAAGDYAALQSLGRRVARVDATALCEYARALG